MESVRKEEQLVVGSPPACSWVSTLDEQLPHAVELERKEGEGKDGASRLGLPGYSLPYVKWAGPYPKRTCQVLDLF